MSNVTNLNQFRKTKKRRERRKTANENAVKFGRTKAQKAQDRGEKLLSSKALDGHILPGDQPSPVSDDADET